MIENYFDIFDLILIALATWRMSYMLTSEDGNMSIAYAVRLLGMKPLSPEISRYEAWKKSLLSRSNVSLKVANNFGKMLTCIWCTSLFVGLVWTLAYLLYGETLVFQILTLGFAIPAVAIMIHDYKFSQ